jgi:type I restriction-modification system DNA methylase subunit
MRPLYGCGFDLFGAVYEMFANNKEKKDFGEYFTRRHYTIRTIYLLN